MQIRQNTLPTCLILFSELLPFHVEILRFCHEQINLKLILHIGHFKSGSTSLQSWLYINSTALKTKGFTYPITKLAHRNYNIVALYGSGYENARDYTLGAIHRSIYGDENSDMRRCFQDELAEIVAEAKNNHQKAVILSTEYLSVLSCGMVERLRDLFNRFFDQVEVIGFARPQAEHLNSAVSEHARNKNGQPLSQLIEQTVDHYGIYKRWSTFFGPFDYVPLKRFQDTVAYFCENVLHLDVDSFEQVEREMRSLTLGLLG